MQRLTVTKDDAFWY